MIKIKTVLVPTDFSEFSELAADYASEIASRFEAEVQLLHVLQNPVLMLPEPDAGAGFVDMEELRRSTENSLKEWSRDRCGQVLNIKCETRVGSPFVEIVRYARDCEIDLIVMGSHGRSGLVHVLLGSVAERVVRKAPCPVLTVRPEGHQFVMP